MLYIDEQWSVLRAALTDSAAGLFGYEKSPQPDWFNPFLQHGNRFHTAWLATDKQEDHVQFKQARGVARRMIRKNHKDDRKAKSDWFAAKAAEIERGSFGGVD